MKGPGLRITLDVRRIWHCRRCGRAAKTPIDVVALRCTCAEEAGWMELEDPPRRKPVIKTIPPDSSDVAEDDLAGDGAMPAEPAAAAPIAAEPTIAESNVGEPIAAEPTVPESTTTESTIADDFGEGIPG